MVRIGPAGWQYRDWQGNVYPNPKPRGFDPLHYIAEYFDTVEINTSFYGPPRESSAQKWIESVRDNQKFKFTAKLYKAFTHERKPTRDEGRDVKAGMAPLMQAGKLGAILAQFPWSFKNDDENRAYLLPRCVDFASIRWSWKFGTRVGSSMKCSMRWRSSASASATLTNRSSTDR